MLEQCENLEEVETFLQAKTFDSHSHKDANYILAILDSRKAFVAHERFQYVLLKKFGEPDLPVRGALSSYTPTLSFCGPKILIMATAVIISPFC